MADNTGVPDASRPWREPIAAGKAWETVVDQHGYGDTERLEVPGGWLYRTTFAGADQSAPPSVAMVFVPDPAQQWKRARITGKDAR